jgi:transketolase
MPLNNVKDKFLAFDWEVIEVEDGNDIDQIRNALAKAKGMTGNAKPIAIILNTVMGNGVDYMMHTHAWHGKAPDDELLEKGLAQNPETLGDY